VEFRAGHRPHGSHCRMTAAVRDWLDAHARPLTTTDPAAPLDDLVTLRDLLAERVVVGIGQPTRASHEVVSQARRVLRLLVEHLGFRAIVMQEDEAAVCRLDAYAESGEGDPREAVSGLWRPWRTAEMAAVAEWAAAFNRARSGDRVRFLGLEPVAVGRADYRRVLDVVAQAAPHRLAELRTHYDTIARAHDVPEHVLRARGEHRSSSFVQIARQARRLVAELPPSTARGPALATADRIVEFHQNSFAGGGFDYAAVRDRSAGIITTLVESGTKVAYWEGLTFTAVAERLDPPALLRPFRAVGHELRAKLGTGYASLLIAFEQGEVGQLHPGQHVPPPMPGSIDAALATVRLDRYLLDLSAPRPAEVTRWLRGPHPLRLVSGIYKATEDHQHYVDAGPLDEWFDAVLHVRRVTSTALL
jgi:erythromycin esterase